MKLNTLFATVVLLALPLIGHTQDVDISDLPPGMSALTIEPGEIAEMPFTALIQQFGNLDAFWYKGYDGSTRLCVRLPVPISQGVIGFKGNCFTLNDIAEFPTLQVPEADIPEKGPDGQM